MEETDQAIRPDHQDDNAVSGGGAGGALARPSGRQGLDLDHYAPFLLNAVSTAWSRQIAGPFREVHGLGVVEWRVLAILSAEPGATASQLCALLRMDKSAISRALHLLSDRDLLSWDAAPGDTRRRNWWLSDKGEALFEDCLDVALKAEARMISGVSAAELETFMTVMRRFLGNLEPPEAPET